MCQLRGQSLRRCGDEGDSTFDCLFQQQAVLDLLDENL